MKRGKGEGKTKSRRDTPVEELGEKESLMHYNAILMEEFNSKMQLILESVQMSTRQLNDKVEAVRVELINAIEMLRLELRSKMNRLDNRGECHESRLCALESRS